MIIYILRDGKIEEQHADNRKEGSRYLLEDGCYISNYWINNDGIHFDDPTLAKIAQTAGGGNLDKTLNALGLGVQS